MNRAAPIRPGLPLTLPTPWITTEELGTHLAISRSIRLRWRRRGLLRC